MKVRVMTLRTDFKTKEVIERPQEIHKDDVACLYYNEGKVYISLKSGIMYLVKHKFQELQEAFEM